MHPSPTPVHVLWISSALKSAHALVSGARRVRDQVRLTARPPEFLEAVTDWDELLADVRAIVVVAACTSGFESGTLRLLRQAGRRDIPTAVWAVDPALRADLAHADRLPADVAEAFGGLLESGDAPSVARALELLCAFVHGTPPDGEAPREPPPVMAYAPAGLAVDPALPAVAVLFSRRLWTEGDLAGIDAVMAALAARGLAPFALHVTTHGADRGSLLKTLVERLAAGAPRAVLSFNAFSLRNMAAGLDEVEALLGRLDVPWLVSPVLQTPAAAWEKSPQGLSARLQTMYVTLPEFDGRISVPPVMARSRVETDPVTGIELGWLTPIEDRCDWVADLLQAQVRLAGTANARKRVALVLHNYPPGDASLGSAAGLDGPASALALLQAMQESGYHVGELPADPDALVAILTSGVTPDVEQLTLRRLEAAPGRVGAKRLTEWLSSWPPAAAEAMRAAWGPPPGELMVHDNAIPVPGRLFGNVLVALQPPRGRSEARAEELHSSDLPPSYPLAAFYLWLQRDFDAHAEVHIGKHGCLEWLPGKASGMGAACFPELLLGPRPHFYAYVVDSFSEGAAVKRRTHGVVVDHLPPPLRAAGEPPEWVPLRRAVDAALQAVQETPDRAAQLAADAVEMAVGLNFHDDLHVDADEAGADTATFVKRLHDHLETLSATVIADGLHVLGRPAEGDRLVRLLEVLARSANGSGPGLHALAAERHGLDLEAASQLNRAAAVVREWIAAVRDGGSTGERTADERVADFLGRMVPRIRDCDRELSALLRLLDGGYLAAGPSGAPTRGALDVLPTGRNFYGIDPRLLPTPIAWKNGEALGRSLIRSYLDKGEPLPETVAMVGFAGSQIRTGGDDLAEALWLMGMRPVWSEPSGFVTGVEPVPVEELGRPRIDVVMRVSGMFRDSLAGAIDLIDTAVTRAAALDEPDADNFIRKHLRNDLRAAVREGLREEEAFRQATYRVFSNAPGRYGAGIAEPIAEGRWRDRDDLAERFLGHGMYAYGRDGNASAAEKPLRRRLSQVDAVVKNWDRQERNLLDSDDFYSYFGGMSAAVASSRGCRPRLFIGRDSDPAAVHTVDYRDEQQRVFRTHAANGNWLAGMRRHGHAGASRMAAAVANVFGLAATTESVDGWMFSDMARQMLFDAENRRFLEEQNPWALQTMAGVLMDAVQRGFWEADDETLAELESAYLAADTLLEGPLN